jgi:negative regulator of genetic competence, sporulation and motility
LNKISANALEFGNLVSLSEEKMLYLEEHGECLIKDRAVSKLRKVYLT